jgi:sulfur carrier protein ThiS
MILIIKHPSYKEINIRGQRVLNDLLRELDIDYNSVLVLKGNTILKNEDIIRDSDVLEILPLINGG